MVNKMGPLRDRIRNSFSNTAVTGVEIPGMFPPQAQALRPGFRLADLRFTQVLTAVLRVETKI